MCKTNTFSAEPPQKRQSRNRHPAEKSLQNPDDLSFAPIVFETMVFAPRQMTPASFTGNGAAADSESVLGAEPLAKQTLYRLSGSKTGSPIRVQKERRAAAQPFFKGADRKRGAKKLQKGRRLEEAGSLWVFFSGAMAAVRPDASAAPGSCRLANSNRITHVGIGGFSCKNSENEPTGISGAKTAHCGLQVLRTRRNACARTRRPKIALTASTGGSQTARRRFPPPEGISDCRLPALHAALRWKRSQVPAR